MTDQPTPPAATRWNEPDSGDEPGFMAPFVPGRRGEAAPRPGPGAAEPAASAPPPAPPAPDRHPEPLPFDVAGAQAPSPVGPAADPEAAGGEDVAERLERLAARVRADGLAGVRALMESDDRLSALLASLIAGYMAGVE